MDNRSINVVSEGPEALGIAMELVWDNAVGGKATHYKVANVFHRIRYYARLAADNANVEVNGHQLHVHHWSQDEEAKDGRQTLILLWHEERDSIALPYPLNHVQAATFAADWLEHANYGRQPDHDGDNGRGWRAFTDGWGHVAGHHYAIVGIQPAWAMYGK